MEVVFLLVVGVVLLFGRPKRRRKPRYRRKSTQKRKSVIRPVQPRHRARRPFNEDTAKRVITQTHLQGRAYIIDGDSLVIQKTQVRLFGVDAPEMNHPYGKKAKWELHALCKGQSIMAEVIAVDAHDRVVAKCTLPDGRDLSAEMVKLGLAIDWPKFSGGVYKSLEVPNARKKMWLADARQKGRMHVWEQYDYDQMRKKKRS